MAIKARNVVPALKDRKITKFVDLSAMPALAGGSALLFRDPQYDLEVVHISALVTVVTTAAASPFKIGYTAYTDKNGVIQVADDDAFLTTALCLDKNGQSFSTAILALGSLHTFTPPGKTGGTGIVTLPRGACLTLIGTNTANTGEIQVTITLRPKDLTNGDASKRPGGAADHS